MSHKSEIYEYLAKKSTTCGVCGGDLSDEIQKYREWVSNPKKQRRKRINLNIDHIVPYSLVKQSANKTSKWGNKDNLQLTHKSCNFAKGNDILLYPRKVELIDKLFKKYEKTK